MKIGALLSEDRKYRYVLWRIWGETKPSVMFIGLNPSTADEKEDDPTIRRCINFAKDWGYGSIFMTNLFALRSTRPKKLYSSSNPVGIDNDRYLIEYADKSELIIACWGNHGSFQNRSNEVAKLINNLCCLEINKSGEPKHPLYIKKDVEIKPFRK